MFFNDCLLSLSANRVSSFHRWGKCFRELLSFTLVPKVPTCKQSNQILAQLISSLPSLSLSPSSFLPSFFSWLLIVSTPTPVSPHNYFLTLIIFTWLHSWNFYILKDDFLQPTATENYLVVASVLLRAKAALRNDCGKQGPRGIWPLHSLKSFSYSLLKLEGQGMIKQQRTWFTNGICFKILMCFWWEERKYRTTFVQ